MWSRDTHADPFTAANADRRILLEPSTASTSDKSPTICETRGVMITGTRQVIDTHGMTWKTLGVPNEFQSGNEVFGTDDARRNEAITRVPEAVQKGERG